MIPLARSVISVPAGASEMPIGRFVLLTTIGSLLWNTALISSGIVLGENWETVTSIVGTYSDMVLVGLAVTTLAAIAYLVYRWRSSARP
jgi:membrane protein DedA with SNARE-associated domain